MNPLFRLMLALHLLALCCEGVLPDLDWLPVGGSELAQLGLTLSVSVIIIEVTEAISHWREGRKGKRRH